MASTLFDRGPALEPSTPRERIAALGGLDRAERVQLLEARVATLKLTTQRKSLPSVASGLRCWHAFATSVLSYRETDTLPPKCARHIVSFVAIFQNPGTARNYVSYVRWACVFHRLSADWHDQELQMVLRGLDKDYMARNLGQLSNKPVLTETLVAQLVTLCDGLPACAELGDLFLASWQFLLRVPSEGIPLQWGTQDELHCLPEGRHSAFVVDDQHGLHLRLRARKHRPRGLLLVRPCCCKAGQLNVLCVGHRVRSRFAAAEAGSRVAQISSKDALKKLQSFLFMLQVPGAERHTWKAFRAGKATFLVHQGFPLPHVLSAGEWSCQAVLRYVPEDHVKNAAFLQAVLDSDDKEAASLGEKQHRWDFVLVPLWIVIREFCFKHSCPWYGCEMQSLSLVLGRPVRFRSIAVKPNDVTALEKCRFQSACCLVCQRWAS